jgi:VanZ family protein
MRALKFAPPLGWTILIAWFSTAGWSTSETSGMVVPVLHWFWPGAAPEQLEALHWLARKAAHAVLYGVLGALWYAALATDRLSSRWRGPLALSVLTAAIDEMHQATTLTRTGSAADVVLDAAAAGVALIALNGGIPQAIRWLTGALLWLGAAGGSALLALHWAADVPSRWLWASTAASWVALILWLARRRRA